VLKAAQPAAAVPPAETVLLLRLRLLMCWSLLCCLLLLHVLSSVQQGVLELACWAGAAAPVCAQRSTRDACSVCLQRTYAYGTAADATNFRTPAYTTAQQKKKVTWSVLAETDVQISSCMNQLPCTL
jgi:hypothetical protein